MDPISKAILLSLARQLPITLVLSFVEDLQAEVHVRFSGYHSLTYDLFFIEEEYVAVASRVQNVLVGATSSPILAVRVYCVEDDGVWRVKSVRAPVALLI